MKKLHSLTFVKTRIYRMDGGAPLAQISTDVWWYAEASLAHELWDQEGNVRQQHLREEEVRSPKTATQFQPS